MLLEKSVGMAIVDDTDENIDEELEDKRPLEKVEADAFKTNLIERAPLKIDVRFRPCGCKYGASPGFRAAYCGDKRICGCCKLIEDVVQNISEWPPLCADCLKHGTWFDRRDRGEL